MSEAFDPDKYLAEKSGVAQNGLRIQTNAQPAFDPDKYLAEKTGQPAAPEQSTGIMAKVGGALSHSHGILAPLGLMTNPAVQDTVSGVIKRGGDLLRTGLASGAGLIAGKDVGNAQDFKKAALGEADPSSKYLERLGVTEGPSVNLPYLGKTSLRDAEGAALDIGTDPVAIGAGLSKGFRPIGSAIEKSGENAYRSGVKKIDERVAEKGAGKLSDLLLENGAKSGTTKTIADETARIGKDALAGRQEAYDRAKQLGAKVDMSEALKSSDALIARMKSDPGLEEAATNLEKLVDKYKAAGKVDLATASEWKSNLYNAMPESAFQGGRLKGPAKKVQGALAKDFKNAIVSAGNEAEDGLGDKVSKLNETLQTTLSADQPLKMQVRRGNTTNAVTPTDLMFGGAMGVMSHDPMLALKAMALKKAADLAKTTGARTTAGKGLMGLGKTGALDAAAVRGLLKNKKGLVKDDEQAAPSEQRLGGGE